MGWFTRKQAPAPVIYEYRRTKDDFNHGGGLGLEREGWELLASSSVSGTIVLYWRRPLRPSPTPPGEAAR